MRSVLFTLFVCALKISSASGQDRAPGSTALSECEDLNRSVAHSWTKGKLADVEVDLSTRLASIQGDQVRRCVWVALHNLATVVALSGRFAEAEVIAERSLRMMDGVFPSDDPIRLRPLQLLWSAQCAQNKVSKARQTVRVIQLIRVQELQDTAMVVTVIGAQLRAEGHFEQAEAEYSRAVALWASSGQGQTTTMSSLLTDVAVLHIRTGRYLDAGKELDRAISIIRSAPNAVPLDLVQALSIRADLHARQENWAAAAEDMGAAVSIAESDTRLDVAHRKIMLTNLEYVLRRAHRGKESRAVKVRSKNISMPPSIDAVVDVSELLQGRKAGGK